MDSFKACAGIIRTLVSEHFPQKETPLGLSYPSLAVKRQLAPDTITLNETTYYLYEDVSVRAIEFENGLSAPWANLENFRVTLERRVDRLNKGERTTAVHMVSKTGMEGYARLMGCVRMIAM